MDLYSVPVKKIKSIHEPDHLPAISFRYNKQEEKPIHDADGSPPAPNHVDGNLNPQNTLYYEEAPFAQWTGNHKVCGLYREEGDTCRHADGWRIGWKEQHPHGQEDTVKDQEGPTVQKTSSLQVLLEWCGEDAGLSPNQLLEGYSHNQERR